MLPLIGIAVLVIGFAARLNPLAVIVAAALTSSLLAGMAPLAVIAHLGKAFNDSRYVSLPWLALPVIGLLERYGLQARARSRLSEFAAATPGRLLILYLALRQITCGLGLIALGGQVQMVRPMLAPMAEGVAQTRLGVLPTSASRLIRACAAATDNIGIAFGEDIFIALAPILMIKSVLHQAGVEVSPLQASMWSAPSAIAAFLIHGARMARLDGRLQRLAAASPDPADAEASDAQRQAGV
jgi:uncharacterized membrane protein